MDKLNFTLILSMHKYYTLLEWSPCELIILHINTCNNFVPFFEAKCYHQSLIRKTVLEHNGPTCTYTCTNRLFPSLSYMILHFYYNVPRHWVTRYIIDPLCICLIHLHVDVCCYHLKKLRSQWPKNKSYLPHPYS